MFVKKDIMIKMGLLKIVINVLQFVKPALILKNVYYVTMKTEKQICFQVSVFVK